MVDSGRGLRGFEELAITAPYPRGPRHVRAGSVRVCELLHIGRAQLVPSRASRRIRRQYEAADMAHFYFHCTNADEVLVDRSGTDLPNLIEAHSRALGIAREIVAVVSGL